MEIVLGGIGFVLFCSLIVWFFGFFLPRQTARLLREQHAEQQRE